MSCQLLCHGIYTAAHPTYQKMVATAIAELKVTTCASVFLFPLLMHLGNVSFVTNRRLLSMQIRKGASRQAIQKYILSNYKVDP